MKHTSEAVTRSSVSHRNAQNPPALVIQRSEIRSQSLGAQSHTQVLKKLPGIVMLILALLPATALAQESPSLQWELVNPFRFISDQKTIDELKGVYRALPATDKSALALERALQARADEVVQHQRAAAKNCDHPSKEQRRQCLAPYTGWFAGLAENDYEKTCWDSKHYVFRNKGACANYIYPKFHRVRVWLNNVESFGNSLPRWITQPNVPVTPCEPKGFCIEFDLPYHIDKSDEIRVAAELAGQTLTLPPIQVKDKLIVGLGDSYAAGEGNPDMPARFTEGKDEHDFLADLLLGGHLKITRSPQSDGGSETRWLDRRCHRSMYSYQFKAALQLALANPQEAITYVTFSCAGGTTPQIVDATEKANEGGGKLRPQLEALHDVLQNGANPIRPIDYLLLSTGGNDIGFATLVAFVVLPKNVIGRLKLDGIPLTEEQIIKDNVEHKFRQTLLTGNKDCGNYRQLQKALFGGNRCPNQPQVTGIRIRDCETGGPCARIILTPYPDVFRKETNELCDGNRGEFDRPFTKDDTRAHRIDLLSKNVFDQISAVQKDEIVRSELGWTLIEANVTAYARHGFCALNPDSTSETAEKFVMPRREHDEWTSFKPWEYRAYETRQRWMRLPVDAKLATNMVHLILGLKVDLFLEDDRSNIMHPTAEGLATTAQLNVDAIRKLQGP
jgi:hypothetical protein